MVRKFLYTFFFTLSLFLSLSFVVAQAVPAVSISSVSPSGSVSPNNLVSFKATASGFSSAVSYTITDSFSGTSMTSVNINSNGNFAWLPTPSDAGAHLITVTATDQLNNTASASQQIVVNVVPTVTIQSLSPGASVTVGTPVFFTASAVGFTNPVYSVTDSVLSATIFANNINSAGGFSWIPHITDIGTHNITVSVSDSKGNSASVVQSITVNSSASSSLVSFVPGSTVYFGQTVGFTLTNSGFTNPTYAATDSFSGSSISTTNMSSSGVFSWTPTTRDIGVHNLTITVSDASYNRATFYLTITMQNANASIQSISPSGVVPVGTPLSFSVVQNGFSNPVYDLTDPFEGTTISLANLNTSSTFNWTPTVSDVGTHFVTVYVKDAYGHGAQVSTSLTVLQSTSTPTVVNANSTSTSTVPSTYIFNTNLSLGSRSVDVTALQNILKSEGYYTGAVTGYFGPLTVVSVKKYQIAHGISPVGYLGSATRDVLNKKVSTQSGAGVKSISPEPKIAIKKATIIKIQYQFNNPLSLGSSGNDVLELQKRLTSEGFYSGTIGGYYGVLTETAVKKYQSAHNLQPLGNLGPATRQVLNQESK